MSRRPSLDGLIDSAQRAAVRAPIEAASPLPSIAFTSDAIFELEIDRIFTNQWCAVGLEQQVPQRGDLQPIELGGTPLLLIRDAEGDLRVFHNIVPYDGCLAVIEGRSGATEIVTPYHGWTYDLTGRLVAIPWWNGTADGGLALLGSRSVDLVPVPSGTAGGIVFVDLGGIGGSFEEFIAPLQRALSGYDLETLAIGLAANGEPMIGDEDLATNWKTHYENWGINVLHESFVHRLYASSRESSGEIPRVGPGGRKTYDDHIDEGLMALRYRLADFPATYPPELMPFEPIGVNGAVPELGYFGSLFPNLHFGVFPRFIHWIVALPEAPGRTRTVRAQFFTPASSADPELLDARVGLRHGLEAAGNEDQRITRACNGPGGHRSTPNSSTHRSGM